VTSRNPRCAFCAPAGKALLDLPRMSEVAEEMMRDSLNALCGRRRIGAKKFWRWTTRWISTATNFGMLTYRWEIRAWCFPHLS